MRNPVENEKRPVNMRAKNFLDEGVQMGTQFSRMANKKTIPEKVTMRPTGEDFALMRKLGEKLGVGNAQVIRIALRRLADHEGLRASS